MNLFLPKHSSCKKEFLESYPWKKRNMERNSYFLQKLGSNSPGFLELESQKKGTQKGMHNLACDNVLDLTQGLLAKTTMY
jgi:hypothetical protein